MKPFLIKDKGDYKMSLNRLNRKQLSDEVAYNYYEAAEKMKRETARAWGIFYLK